MRYTGRTASGMIKDMFNPYTMPSPGKTIPPSPSTTSTSSVSNDSVFASPERTSSYSESARYSPSSWNECQREHLSTSETITSEEEGDLEEEAEDTSNGSFSVSFSSKNSNPSTSSISSISTNASVEGTLCRSEGGENIQGGGILSHGQSMTAINSAAAKRGKKKAFGRSSSSRDETSPDRFLQNFNPKNKMQKVPSDQGYFTFRRPNKSKAKSKGKKMAHRFSMKPQKMHMVSVSAEISSPSAVTKASIGNTSSSHSPCAGETSLTRHPAFRSKRGMRIGQSFSDTIPEASFTFEMSAVPVVFKSTKMEVPCRGERTVMCSKISHPMGLPL